MAKIRFSIIVTVLLSIVIGAGLAYVGIPAIDPKYNTNTSPSTTQTKTLTQTVTQTPVQTGVVNEISKSWQDESYLFDYNLQWSKMNQTQMNFTIDANSKIMAQFSAPLLLTVDSSFTGTLYFAISVVIEASNNTVIGNTTAPIIYYNDAPASGHFIQLNYYPTLNLMTPNLPAGTYNCSVQWRSTIDAPGISSLSVSHSNINSAYHYDRWMVLQEVIS